MTDKINEKKVIKGKIKPFKRGTALDKQVGGEHYKNKAGTQYEPINLIVDYKLDFIDGSIEEMMKKDKDMKILIENSALQKKNQLTEQLKVK